MKRFILLLLFAITLENVSFPQEQSILLNHNNVNQGMIYDLKSDASDFFKNGLSFIESPLHLDTGDMILTGVFFSAAGLAYTMDKTVYINVGNMHNSVMDKMEAVGLNFGEQKYAYILGGVIYTGGFLIRDAELRETGLMLTEALFLSGSITGILKTGIGRARPSAHEGNNDFDLFNPRASDHSFPSGHTTVAFTLASVLSERIDNPYATAALYSLAGFTAFERIYEDAHWFSDVIAGAAIGTVTGLKIVKIYSHEHQQSTGKTTFSIMPLVSNSGYGMDLSLSF